MIYTEKRPAFKDLAEMRDNVKRIMARIETMMNRNDDSCGEDLIFIYNEADELHKHAHFVLLAEAEREPISPPVLFENYKPDFAFAAQVQRDLMDIESYIASVSDDGDTVQRASELWESVDELFSRIRKMCSVNS